MPVTLIFYSLMILLPLGSVERNLGKEDESPAYFVALELEAIVILLIFCFSFVVFSVFSVLLEYSRLGPIMNLACGVMSFTCVLRRTQILFVFVTYSEF